MRRLLHKAGAVVRQLCPRCHHRGMFSGIFEMRGACPQCGLKFEREEGYWTGAMLINWLLVSVTLIPLGAVLLIRGMPFPVVLLLTFVLLILLLPVFFRYSRIIWLHFDHRMDSRRE